MSSVTTKTFLSPRSSCRRLRSPVGVITVRRTATTCDEGPLERASGLQDSKVSQRAVPPSAEPTPANPSINALDDVIRGYDLPLQRFLSTPRTIFQCHPSAMRISASSWTTAAVRDPVGRRCSIVCAARKRTCRIHPYARRATQQFLAGLPSTSARTASICRRTNDRYGITESQVARRTRGRWPELMRFQTERARAMLKSGAHWQPPAGVSDWNCA